MTEQQLSCDQLETPEDDCCGPEERCGAEAAWLHEGSGFAMCATHEASAREWSDGATWRIGPTEVSYPAGWLQIRETSDAPASSGGLEIVTFSSDSGLSTSSGLIDRG